MKRRLAREIAFCLVFEKDFMKELDCKTIYNTALQYFDNDEIDSEPYIWSTFAGVFDKVEVIDEQIALFSEKWESDRISRVSRAILRLAIYEVLFAEDVPAKIAANEAVELAKKYDDDKAFSFINGVLAKVISTNNAE